MDAIPCLASVLSNLTTYMENLTWSTQFSLENGEMVRNEMAWSMIHFFSKTKIHVHFGVPIFI